MTVGMKPVSEYKRQYTWHDIAPIAADPMAGCPSFKEKLVTEPPLQAKQRPTLELASKEELPEVIRTFGSPSKDLHISREPSFSHKKRVPGASPERVKANKSLEKRAGLSKNINSARYKSEYGSKFSPTKGSVPRPSSPIQTSKLNFVDSKTNLPIGKKPVEKKVQSEYGSRFQDPTSELKYIRELYKEQVRRKRLELEKAETEKKDDPSPKPEVPKPVEETQEGKESEPVKESEEKKPEMEKPAVKVPEKKIKLKIVSPLKGTPKIKATYDLIAEQRPVKLNWKSEYKSKFESPVKEKSSPAAPSAYGRRSHPYKNASPEKVENLIKPDPSEIISSPTRSQPVNWFGEVLELRKLAHEFKARSHGSHFSPNKLAHLSFSTARLRECEPIPSPPSSAESVKVIPTAKAADTKEATLPVAVPAVINDAAKVETDLTVTDLEEVPNIDNLVIKTKSLSDVGSKDPSPKETKPKSPKVLSPKEVTVVAEKESSICSTPRTAERSYGLFGDRVPTPRLKNQGSRHHFDRTTRKDKSESIPRKSELKTAVLAGRVSTPTLQEQGGSRHHLDGTTPFVVKTEEKPSEGTQPFFPVLSDQIKEKLDFSTPSKPKSPTEEPKAANGWTKDLDTSVLSRASSCTSLASATLSKAQQRGADFWKPK